MLPNVMVIASVWSSGCRRSVSWDGMRGGKAYGCEGEEDGEDVIYSRTYELSASRRLQEKTARLTLCR